jgi:ribosome biogenesis GTPase
LGLRELGWDASFEEAWRALSAEDLVPGRVIAGHARVFRVATAEGELQAELAGRLRHAARGPLDLPAVGDWVALRPRAGERRALLQAVLARRSAFVRRAAGKATVAQLLAANVDTAFLVMGLDADFNPRRLERALVLARESGVEPVVVLNKADLCRDVEARRAEVERTAIGASVLVVAAKAGLGLEALAAWLSRGRTVVLLGSSGVGKSTLVNRLLGEERQRTREVRRRDERGQHTTARRELIALPGGALLIDTPGLREVQLWASAIGLSGVFEDVERLAGACRFRDCSHDQEPGCAVRAAVAAGDLPAERLESFRKLRGELRALEVRDDPERQRRRRREWRSIHRAARKHRPRE